MSNVYRNSNIEKIKQYQKSDKLIVFTTSSEVFRNNFWLNLKEYKKNFDICCINYSILYMDLYDVDINYFFSIDDDIFNEIKDEFSSKMKESLFFTNKYMYQKDNKDELDSVIVTVKSSKILNNDDNYSFNSGIACLHEFMRHGVYKEIHLIGLNLIPSSGGIVKRRRLFIPDRKGLYAQRRFENSVKIVKILQNHYPKIKVFKTYEKSNIPGLEFSDTFYTLKENVININRKFKSII